METRPLQREPHLQGGSRRAGEAGELGAASGQCPEPSLMPLGPFWRAEGGEVIPDCLTWRLKGGRAQCVQGLSSASRQPSLWLGRGIGAVPPGPFLGTAALTPQHALFSACLQELWVQRGAQLRLYLATPPQPLLPLQELSRWLLACSPQRPRGHVAGSAEDAVLVVMLPPPLCDLGTIAPVPTFFLSCPPPGNPEQHQPPAQRLHRPLQSRQHEWDAAGAQGTAPRSRSFVRAEKHWGSCGPTACCRRTPGPRCVLTGLPAPGSRRAPHSP